MECPEESLTKESKQSNFREHVTELKENRTQQLSLSTFVIGVLITAAGILLQSLNVSFWGVLLALVGIVILYVVCEWLQRPLSFVALFSGIALLTANTFVRFVYLGRPFMDESAESLSILCLIGGGMLTMAGGFEIHRTSPLERLKAAMEATRVEAAASARDGAYHAWTQRFRTRMGRTPTRRESEEFLSEYRAGLGTADLLPLYLKGTYGSLLDHYTCDLCGQVFDTVIENEPLPEHNIKSFLAGCPGSGYVGGISNEG